MKILLAQNVDYYPALGGSNRSNRTLLEGLAKLGHECLVVATTKKDSHTSEILASLHPHYINEEIAVFNCNNICVHAVKVHAALDCSKLKNHLREQIHSFNPDFIFISTEDIGQVLLETAIHEAAHKVIYLARTTLYLPFGPGCYMPSTPKTKLLKYVGGIVCVGDYVKDYIKTYGDLDSVVLPISLFGKGPFPDYHQFGKGYVTMINPCAYKGISIFLGLAKHFKNIPFAAIPTWGTTTKDLEALRALPNVTLFEPTNHIDEIYAQSTVVLVPSLWAEAKSRTIVEAMARGLPVLASNIGGNPEAKLGIPYVLPVNPITHYEELCDEKSLPITQVPEQNLDPWINALSRLLTDKVYYEELAHLSRKAAISYIENRGGVEKVESYLIERLKNSKPIELPKFDNSPLNHLTPKQRALLVKRLNQKSNKRGEINE